jgi:hypothetical protein
MYSLQPLAYFWAYISSQSQALFLTSAPTPHLEVEAHQREQAV